MVLMWATAFAKNTALVLNSDIFMTSCPDKGREPNLPYYLTIVGMRGIGWEKEKEECISPGTQSRAEFERGSSILFLTTTTIKPGVLPHTHIQTHAHTHTHAHAHTNTHADICIYIYIYKISKVDNCCRGWPEGFLLIATLIILNVKQGGIK